MKILDVVQNTPEWEQARCGRPTASQYHRIIQPKKLKLSDQSSKYRNELLAEWFVGHPIDWGGRSAFMERGHDLEAEARAAYEFMHDVEVQQVGFVLRDDERTGGSPDGLVEVKGGVDFKCPALHTHIGYMLDDGADYNAQAQGLMYLTDREWWDIVSFCPGLPLSIRRVERDDKFIAALERVLNQFLAWLDEGREKLAAHRQQGAAA